MGIPTEKTRGPLNLGVTSDMEIRKRLLTPFRIVIYLLRCVQKAKLALLAEWCIDLILRFL